MDIAISDSQILLLSQSQAATVTGAEFNYYLLCKRKLWLFSPITTSNASLALNFES